MGTRSNRWVPFFHGTFSRSPVFGTSLREGPNFCRYVGGSLFRREVGSAPFFGSEFFAEIFRTDHPKKGTLVSLVGFPRVSVCLSMCVGG